MGSSRRALVVAAALALALWTPRAQAACPVPTGVAELAVQLNKAQQAFAQMDTSGFRTQRELAQVTYGCLAEVVTPSTAVAYHQLEALDAFLFRDTEGATTAFQAVLRANPRYELSPDIAPRGHPLWQLVQDAKTLPPGTQRTLDPPGSLTLRVDGRPGTEVSDGVPSVLQLTTQDFEVSWTGYLRAGGADPDWAGVAPLMVASEPEPEPVAAAEPEPVAAVEPEPEPEPAPTVLEVPPEPVAERSGRHRALGVGAGVSALATGGMLLIANAQENRYTDPDNPDIQDQQQLQDLRTRNKIVVRSSAITGVLAVGLTVGAVVSWKF